METIHKYGPFEAIGVEVKEKLPRGAELLYFAAQHDQFNVFNNLFVWAKVDTASPMVNRHFYVVGTGQPTPEYGKYVGTTFDGLLVWHLFDLGEE